MDQFINEWLHGTNAFDDDEFEELEAMGATSQQAGAQQVYAPHQYGRAPSRIPVERSVPSVQSLPESCPMSIEQSEPDSFEYLSSDNEEATALGITEPVELGDSIGSSEQNSVDKESTVAFCLMDDGFSANAGTNATMSPWAVPERPEMEMKPTIGEENKRLFYNTDTDGDLEPLACTSSKQPFSNTPVAVSQTACSSQRQDLHRCVTNVSVQNDAEADRMFDSNTGAGRQLQIEDASNMLTNFLREVHSDSDEEVTRLLNELLPELLEAANEIETHVMPLVRVKKENPESLSDFRNNSLAPVAPKPSGNNDCSLSTNGQGFYNSEILTSGSPQTASPNLVIPCGRYTSPARRGMDRDIDLSLLRGFCPQVGTLHSAIISQKVCETPSTQRFNTSVGQNVPHSSTLQMAMLQTPPVNSENKPFPFTQHLGFDRGIDHVQYEDDNNVQANSEDHAPAARIHFRKADESFNAPEVSSLRACAMIEAPAENKVQYHPIAKTKRSRSSPTNITVESNPTSGPSGINVQTNGEPVAKRAKMQKQHDGITESGRDEMVISGPSSRVNMTMKGPSSRRVDTVTNEPSKRPEDMVLENRNHVRSNSTDIKASLKTKLIANCIREHKTFHDAPEDRSPKPMQLTDAEILVRKRRRESNKLSARDSRAKKKQAQMNAEKECELQQERNAALQQRIRELEEEKKQCVDMLFQRATTNEEKEYLLRKLCDHGFIHVVQLQSTP